MRGSDSAVNAAIRVRRLVQFQCQDGTDELIRFALGEMCIRDRYGAEGAMELAKKLNNETCASLHAEFGEKAAFLEQLAKELLVLSLIHI